MIFAMDTSTKTREQDWVNVSSSILMVRKVSRVVAVLLLINKVTQLNVQYNIIIFCFQQSTTFEFF